MKQRILLSGVWLDIQNRGETDEYGWFTCELVDGVDKVVPMEVCQDMIAAIIDQDGDESAPAMGTMAKDNGVGDGSPMVKIKQS